MVRHPLETTTQDKAPATRAQFEPTTETEHPSTPRNEWTLMAIAISAGKYKMSASSSRTDFELVENFVLNVNKLDSGVVIRVLRVLIKNENLMKVFFDVRLAACWLHEHGLVGVELNKCVDAQLAFEVVSRHHERFVDLEAVYRYSGQVGTTTPAVNAGVNILKGLIENDPIPHDSPAHSGVQPLMKPPSSWIPSEEGPVDDEAGLMPVVRLFPTLSPEEVLYRSRQQAEKIASFGDYPVEGKSVRSDPDITKSRVKVNRPAPLLEFAGPHQQTFGFESGALHSRPWGRIPLNYLGQIKHEADPLCSVRPLILPSQYGRRTASG